ncbi:MAG TPA: S53 family peptidase [Streptosporangiaceae bacterium]|nr:S53 family peptidase [Streptosporangiaceae bacterium]
MTESGYVQLTGSDRGALDEIQLVGPADPDEWLELTIVTRRMASLPATAAGAPAPLSRAELRESYGSAPADQDFVASVLTSLDPAIEVTGADPGSRLMTIAGPSAVLAQAFGTELSQVTSAGPAGSRVSHRYRTGALLIPAALDGVVVAVVGLDNRPQAASQVRQVAPELVQVSYTPPEVASLYTYPVGTDGTGQTVAIIELGGGFAQSDLTTYFSGLGLATPSVTAVGVDGASNVPDEDPQGADLEVLLDIEVLGSMAPGAAQLVYFAPNTDQGFIDAITTAVHAEPTPAALSISWGGPESSWTTQAMTALDEAIADGVAIGVTVCVAAGDNGSSDGVSDGEPHVDFPASSPHALGCGGTSLQADPSTGVITSETVWNDGAGGGATGGGVSAAFALPAWQATAGVPTVGAPSRSRRRRDRRTSDGGTGRGVPDVAGNADPATGYQVLVDGDSTVLGGTSAVAPLWAALIARLTEALGNPTGLIQTALYAGIEPGQPVAGLRDITIGNNGAYSAGPGWDACTGLGVPEGAALLSRLSAGS